MAPADKLKDALKALKSIRAQKANHDSAYDPEAEKTVMEAYRRQEQHLLDEEARRADAYEAALAAVVGTVESREAEVEATVEPGAWDRTFGTIAELPEVEPDRSAYVLEGDMREGTEPGSWDRTFGSISELPEVEPERTVAEPGTYSVEAPKQLTCPEPKSTGRKFYEPPTAPSGVTATVPWSHYYSVKQRLTALTHTPDLASAAHAAIEKLDSARRMTVPNTPIVVPNPDVQVWLAASVNVVGQGAEGSAEFEGDDNFGMGV